MANEKATPKDGRSRIWVAVVYPESAPENWQDILDEQHIEWAESPLHDQDVNPGTGEAKKPHWHIVLAFDGKKSFEQVQDLLAPLNCPIPQRCHALKGAVRYMAHLDNPEKVQYPVSSIKSHGGFDVAAALAPSSAQRYELIKEMQEWCSENCCIEMQDLMDYAREHRFDDWFPLLCDSCCIVMNAYLKSARHRVVRRDSPQEKKRAGGVGPRQDFSRGGHAPAPAFQQGHELRMTEHERMVAAAVDRCPYGCVECGYWHPHDKCFAPDQGPDYCRCFDPGQEPELLL